MKSQRTSDMKSIEIKAPLSYGQKLDHRFSSVFLAGSIEMGTAEKWHQKVIDAIPNNVIFLNPRRDDWDSSWKQDANDPQFYQQVTWELNMLKDSDIVFMYLDPNTTSPISLLELGLYARHDEKMLVCCPEGFWRKGNVDIVCQRHGIPVFTNLDTAIIALQSKLASCEGSRIPI